MNKRRLLRLASILDKADAEHRKRGEKTYVQDKFVHACGTPACALAHWAAANKRRGWSLPSRREDGSTILGTPRLNGLRVWADSVSVLDEFDISTGQADELFGCYGCNNARTAKQAASYIRKFIKRNEGKV